MAVTAPDSLQLETTNRYTLVTAFYLQNKAMVIISAGTEVSPCRPAEFEASLDRHAGIVTGKTRQ